MINKIKESKIKIQYLNYNKQCKKKIKFKNNKYKI